MHTLFYCSVATREMRDSDILDILKVSKEKKDQHQITGILAYKKQSHEFFQILEGRKKDIFQLLENIRDDDRNTSLDLVYDIEIEDRNFKDWSMGFADLDSVDNKKLDGFSEYLNKGFTSELTQENQKNANTVIKMFQHYLLDCDPT